MSSPQVIVTTFAGREDRMQLLVDHILLALNLGIVTEYHVWDYARCESDRNWLKTLPALHPQIKLLSSNGPPFDSYYDYYQKQDFHDAIFIKADDDIVYIDLENLPNFISYRMKHPEPFLLSANVINNGVCAFFQQQTQAIPRKLMHLPYPKDGFCGLLWESSEMAQELHHYFLNNKECFSYSGTEVALDRLSINFVSYLGKDLEHICGIRGDDEQELSVTIPQRLNRSNLIYNDLIVSHLSFFSQEKELDHTSLLSLYKSEFERRYPPS